MIGVRRAGVTWLRLDRLLTGVTEGPRGDATPGRRVDGSAAIVFVLVQQPHSREGLRAAVAFVLLHVRMGLHMRSEVRAIGEGAAAAAAFERLLAGVCANVPVQQPHA